LQNHRLKVVAVKETTMSDKQDQDDSAGDDEEYSSQDEPLSEGEDDNGNDASPDRQEDEDQEGQNLMDGLPDYIVRRVEALKLLDKKRDVIMVDYLRERAELEARYGAKYEPLYSDRAKIVKGENDDESNDTNQTKGIPQFWVIAMGHEPTIASIFEPEDIDCLEYIEDIKCFDDTDGKGFTLKFFFKENPFFENLELTKKYEVPNLLLGDEPVLKNVKGCVIQWKPNQCLTYKSVEKKQRGKGKKAGQIRTITYNERQESFFHWFEPPQMPNLEDMNEEEAEKLDELFGNDFEIAQTFRGQVIPKAVQWFTGDVSQQDLDSAVNALINGE
jgi:nucleosome assembly protein 1-like 1